jgi:uncharacterized membrane-anchored protein
LADYCTRSLGIGYTGGSAMLLFGRDRLASSLALVRWQHLDRNSQYHENGGVYWVTIMFSQTLGTALGD